MVFVSWWPVRDLRLLTDAWIGIDRLVADGAGARMTGASRLVVLAPLAVFERGSGL